MSLCWRFALHYYQFNIGDYARRTRHLSNLEDLAYRRLIDLYYTTESPLEDNIKKLSRLIYMRDNQEEIENVLSDFFVLSNGFWSNKRADEEISKYQSNADRARANGKKGGRPKKKIENPEETQEEPNSNPEETQPVISENPEETESKAKHKTITKNQEPLNSNQETGVTPDGDEHLQQSLLDDVEPEEEKPNKEDGFYDWWAEYPKKASKKDALKAWVKSDCYKIKDQIIDDTINRSRSHHQWQDKQFIPNGSTYLNGERWNDEIITKQKQKPFFEQQNDALREKLFGNAQTIEGECYEPERES